MSNDEIINVIKKYVKGVCENDSTGHDWWHIQRVYNNAMLINKKENADPHAITFVLKNDNIINSKEYLQTGYNVGKLNLQESNHTHRVNCSFEFK